MGSGNSENSEIAQSLRFLTIWNQIRCVVILLGFCFVPTQWHAGMSRHGHVNQTPWTDNALWNTVRTYSQATWTYSRAMECTTSQQWQRRKNWQSLVSLTSGWKPCLLCLWWDLLDIKEVGSNLCTAVIIYKIKMLPLQVRLVTYLDPLRRTTLSTHPLTHHWDSLRRTAPKITGCVEFVDTPVLTWYPHTQFDLITSKLSQITTRQITVRLSGHLGPFRTLLLAPWF